MDNILLCVCCVYTVYPIHTGNWLWTVGAAWHIGLQVLIEILGGYYVMWLYSIHVEQNFYLQVTPPESMTPRYYHSITATSLGPGLTEVLVFGGHREWGGNDLAETTILRFGEQLLVHAAIATILSDRHVHTRRGWSWFKLRRNMLVFGLEFAFNFLQPAGSALLSLSHVISLVLHFLLAEEVRQSHDQPKGLCILYEYHSRLYVLW